MVLRSKFKKLAIALLIAVLAIVAYGAVSWQVLQKPTLMSRRLNCMPGSINPEDLMSREKSSSEKLSEVYALVFGSKCVMW